MFREITVQRLTAGSIFKLAAIGMFGFLVPFSLLMGVGALFGASTVTWNQQPITGLAGLAASPFIGAFVAAIFTLLLGAFMALGLGLFSLVRPLTLLVKELPAEEEAPQA
ncbi:MAG TPA: hypothetical protein VK188_04725 [Holophaga sp.]|nr:hypothetical protein [Holophaga sp.]